MRCRFLHMADVHLGFKQYGLDERADDFAAAFYQAVDAAIEASVDFVLLAGDLFHKRQVDAMTLNYAVLGLARLRSAGIPVVAVEGNHELSGYGDNLGWMQYLALQDYLVLLRPAIHTDPLMLDSHRLRKGAYVDIRPGVRVYGLHFTGAAAGKHLNRYAEAIAALSPEEAVHSNGEPVAYRIFLAHAGVQNLVPNDLTSPSHGEWGCLDGQIDYIALGHIHKPFDHDERIYNPGSLETCSADEVDWESRGYLLVDVDSRNAPPHKVRRIRSERRPWLRLNQKVDGIASVAVLHARCIATLRGQLEAQGTPGLKPIIDLALTGTLAFGHQSLELDELRRVAQAEFNACHVIVRNLTSPLSVAGAELRELMSRDEMEALTFTALYAADHGYREHAEVWALSTQEVKRLALMNASPALITDQIDGAIEAVAMAQAPAPAQDPVQAEVVTGGGDA